ncbi:PP2C family protein-serine/threonine phosphatase [Paeniglutamicibacter psychrophenolicus]|uniref:Serine phosphatase RsbU (Regulator of sigma subunit) n=1 Tax=Paeniglutamicibacter psychrophenolicus TaxID=257454 RepID=A0ABS4WKU9_9MICC|nr:PP2C family protein-serine/threonine phosphatase [Paeniglutamicibacter psychrophenolicus]MBP2376194.1 serine phosphatase RsbU (regulator of sigma subunit) [Paeniglutamicibacter psychrophenolicus]
MTSGPARILAGLDELSPLRKQIPFAGLFLVAALMAVLLPTVPVSSVTSLIAGLAVVAVALVLAVIFGRPALLRFAIIVPALDFVAAGLLRHGTGESHSIFAAILLLPLLWFAARAGRRYVIYAVLGTILSVMVPFMLGAQRENNPNELARGIFNATVFAISATVVNMLAARARQHLGSARAEAAAAAEELSRAAQIQKFLLPKKAAILPGYETAGACIPSRAVGGDFFDWYAIDGGLGFTLGDVMGKGAGAGMIAATTRAVIRSARNSDDPVKALALTSDCLATELSQAAAFATLFHARLRASDGRVLFSDAGHGLSLLIRGNGTWERLTSHELPVGLMPDATWTSREIWLAPGDMIVSFSDGVLDLYDGTLAAIAEVAELALNADCAQDIVDAVHKMASGNSNPDDVTVLAVRRSELNTAVAQDLGLGDGRALSSVSKA